MFKRGLTLSTAMVLCLSGRVQAQVVSAPADTTPPQPSVSPPAPAKAAQGSVEDVIVTAQKRSQRLQDVPIAVSVIDNRQLARQQVNTINDLDRTTPELEFVGPNQGPGGGAEVRGIGTQVFSFSAEPSVGIVVDGVSLGVGNTNNIFDVSRVEILPGPQGMLFGQSASAGLLNITTNAPDPSGFYGSLSTELADRGIAGSDISQYVTRLMLNVPISDNTAVRGAIHYTDNKLQYDALSGKYDDNSDPGGRVRLKTSGEDWTLNLIADYDREVSHGGNFLTFYSVPQGSGLQKALAKCGIVASESNNENCDQLPTNDDYETWGFSGQLDYQLGDNTLSVISAVRNNAFHRAEDIATLPADLVSGVFIDNADQKLRGSQFTQEIRIASPSTYRLEYTAGLYYSNYGQYEGQPGEVYFPIFGQPFPSPNGDTIATDVSSAAVFGQATYHITPKWRLIAGGRLTEIKVKDALRDIYDPGQKTIDLFDRNASWRVGTQYSVTRDLMGYFTISRGFKGPTVNDSNSLSSEAYAVKAEIPTDYELGVKSTLLGGKLAIDGNLFHSMVRDFQTQGCYVDVTLHLNVCGAENVPSVTTQGVQVNVFGRPLPNLTLNSGVLYNDARYPKGFLAGDGTNIGGDQLVYAPLWKFTFSGEYRQPINDKLEGFFDADGVYKSSVLEYPTAQPGFDFHDNWVVGLRTGVQDPTGRWSVALFVRNLFDIHQPLTLYSYALAFAFPHTGTTVQGFYGVPTGRMVGFSAAVKF